MWYFYGRQTAPARCWFPWPQRKSHSRWNNNNNRNKVKYASGINTPFDCERFSTTTRQSGVRCTWLDGFVDCNGRRRTKCRRDFNFFFLLPAKELMQRPIRNKYITSPAVETEWGRLRWFEAHVSTARQADMALQRAQSMHADSCAMHLSLIVSTKVLIKCPVVWYTWTTPSSDGKCLPADSILLQKLMDQHEKG